jgi:hypothetical protein
MLVYHVDWDGAYLCKWRTHTINTDPNHQCATIFRSNPSATTENSKGWFFPGSRNVTTISYDGTPVFQNWNFEKLPYNFTDITIDGSKVIMNAQIKDLTIDARQYDAMINWQPSETKSDTWRVTFTNEATGEQRELTTTNKYINLTPLNTDTHYSAQIYAGSENTPVYEVTFLTQGNVFSPRSALFLGASCSSKDIIRLSVKNLEFTPREIVWYIDGKIVEPCVELKAGKYQVCAVITDTEGNTHHIYRYITVK